MSENWDWRKSLRNEEMLSEYSKEKSAALKKNAANAALNFLDALNFAANAANVEKTIVLKYRPTGFEPKWMYWFHIEPGVTKQIKASEETTIGVKKTNSTSVVDSATASVGFPIDIISIKVEASTSKTTLNAVERNVTKTYNKSVTDTYDNKTDSTKVFYHLYGIITYADGIKTNYNTGFHGVSINGVGCIFEEPKQSARESWDYLMAH